MSGIVRQTRQETNEHRYALHTERIELLRDLTRTERHFSRVSEKVRQLSQRRSIGNTNSICTRRVERWFASLLDHKDTQTVNVLRTQVLRESETKRITEQFRRVQCMPGQTLAVTPAADRGDLSEMALPRTLKKFSPPPVVVRTEAAREVAQVAPPPERSPGLDVAGITATVMREIDRKLLAHRERLGRVR
jgi:uncharacterized protein with von Willebrand factor type A (vWA) domain